MNTFDELGDGIYRRRYQSLDLNIGVVVGDDGILLIDTRASHRQADELRDELRTLTDLPTRWVVNTHFHWDHTWGNARFPEASVWGHEQCRHELVANGELARQRVLDGMPAEHHDEIREVVITPPTNTFAERMSLDIGREIRLSYHGLGHTNSDIVVLVPTEGVLFAGDLLEEGAPPSFGDAYPLDWATTLGKLQLPSVVVPGHGDVVDRDFVTEQAAEIGAAAGMARAGHEAGRPIDDLVDAGPYPPATMRWAVSRVYAQLEGEI